MENWGDRGAEVMINGTKIPPGRSFRYGHIRRVNRYDLVVWLRLNSERSAEIIIQPVEEN